MRRTTLSIALVLTTLLSAQALAPDTKVYVTKTGAKYHRDGCRYLRSSKIEMALSEAKRRFDPCKVCRPPTR